VLSTEASDLALPQIRRDTAQFTIMSIMSTLLLKKKVLPSGVYCFRMLCQGALQFLHQLINTRLCPYLSSLRDFWVTRMGHTQPVFWQEPADPSPSPLLQLGIIGPSSLHSAPSTQICKLLVTECKITALVKHVRLDKYAFSQEKSTSSENFQLA